jgi:hypothetical protein
MLVSDALSQLGVSRKELWRWRKSDADSMRPWPMN